MKRESGAGRQNNSRLVTGFQSQIHAPLIPSTGFRLLASSFLVEDWMSYKTRRIFAALTTAVLALAAFGCTSTPDSNGNRNANANANSNTSAAANANTSTVASSPFSIAEPERYSLKMTVSG